MEQATVARLTGEAAMTRNEDTPKIPEIRAYAQERIDVMSIRTLAREIGVVHSTLHNFLQGAAPHPRVRRKLVDWYRLRTGSVDLADHPCLHAVRGMLQDMTPAGQEYAAGVLLNQLERLYIGACCPVPPWITAAIDREEFGGEILAGAAPASVQA